MWPLIWAKFRSVVSKHNSIRCVPSELSICNDCAWTLGVTIPSEIAAVPNKAVLLGNQFIEHVPGGFAQAVNFLSELEYPLVDCLSLLKLLEERAPDASDALLSRLTFPVLTLADALDKLCTNGPLPSVPAGELLRLAVGDYSSKLTNSLAHALATGAIEINEESRELRVRMRNDVSVDVSCECAGPGGGFCEIKISGQMIFCSAVGTCDGVCWQVVKIPSGSLYGLSAGFVLS